MSGLSPAGWFAIGAATALSALALALLHRWRGRLPHAQPIDRSLHGRPVMRAGGLAIWAGFLPVVLVLQTQPAASAVWLCAWMAVTAVSIADDWRSVRPAVRLIVHALAALAVSISIFQPDGDFSLADGIVVALAAFAIVGSANLFNFMDGNDGLAALMAVCGFGAYAAAAAHSGEPADVYCVLIGATLPFLFVNLPPARVFMGDCGSVPLGFLAAAFGLEGVRAQTWPGWFPLLVFLPFIADTVVTLVKRLIVGENLLLAHKTHYYQRLHRMGAGHAGTLLLYGIVVAGTCATAYLALSLRPAAGWQILGAWTVAIGGLFAGIDYHWRRWSPGRR